MRGKGTTLLDDWEHGWPVFKKEWKPRYPGDEYGVRVVEKGGMA